MAIDMKKGGTGAGTPNYRKQLVYKQTIDFAEVLAEKGSALAAADVIEVFQVPAGCVVEYANITPKVVCNAEATVLIMDLGDGVTPALYVDGTDGEALTDGVPIMTVQKYYPVTDTVDLTIQALTGTLTTGKVQISIAVREFTI